MDDGQTSFDLLAHFDRPKTSDPSATLRVAGVEQSEPQGIAPEDVPYSECGDESWTPQQNRRGICWVFAWTAALTVLAFTAGILIEFAYVVGAEQSLAIAARS